MSVFEYDVSIKGNVVALAIFYQQPEDVTTMGEVFYYKASNEVVIKSHQFPSIHVKDSTGEPIEIFLWGCFPESRFHIAMVELKYEAWAISLAARITEALEEFKQMGGFWGAVNPCPACGNKQIRYHNKRDFFGSNKLGNGVVYHCKCGMMAQGDDLVKALAVWNSVKEVVR